MTRADLIIEVAKQTGGSKKDAAAYIDAVLKGITEGMKRDSQVKLANFATISTQVKPEHEARNPKNGEKIIVPDKVIAKVKFMPAVMNYLNSK